MKTNNVENIKIAKLNSAILTDLLGVFLFELFSVFLFELLSVFLFEVFSASHPAVLLCLPTCHRLMGLRVT
jgi:hypothetical protein